MHDDERITTQQDLTSFHTGKWGYTLELPGYGFSPSAYRYGSEATARKAGEKDLAGWLELQDAR